MREAIAAIVAVLALGLFFMLGTMQEEASLVVTVEPIGARVRLLEPSPIGNDDVEVIAAAGRAVYGTLPAGRDARVLVSAPGYRQSIGTVALKKGDNRLKIILDAESPFITVVTEPPGAQVFVDNRLRGPSPIILDDVPSGAHVISARLPGYRPASQELLVTTASEQRIELKLEPVDAPPGEEPVPVEEEKPYAPGFGRLIMTSTHHATFVFENQMIGMGTKVIRDVLAGPHLVGCKAEGRGMQTRRIEVIEESVERVDCEFNEDPLERALRATDPKEPIYWVNLGGTTRNQGQYDDSIKMFKRALELDPTYFEAHRQLGFTLPALKEWDDAIEHMEQYLELNPHAPDRDFAREMIGVYEKEKEKDD